MWEDTKDHTRNAHPAAQGSLCPNFWIAATSRVGFCLCRTVCRQIEKGITNYPILLCSYCQKARRKVLAAERWLEYRACFIDGSICRNLSSSADFQAFDLQCQKTKNPKPKPTKNQQKTLTTKSEFPPHISTPPPTKTNRMVAANGQKTEKRLLITQT